MVTVEGAAVDASIQEDAGFAADSVRQDPRFLFDSRRGLSYSKPRWRGWSHLVFFELSLTAGTILLAGTHGVVRLVAAGTYAGAVSSLFGASALYHRGQWRAAAAKRLQRLDHAMIFVLIAGTATPPFLLCVPAPYGVVGVLGIWVLTLTALVRHLGSMNASERLTGAIFVALGWTSGAAVPAVWAHAGAAPALLLVTGGVLYTVGAFCYHRRRPDPIPAVFGYHEVFHAYVCAAAACHYVAIACFIL